MENKNAKYLKYAIGEIVLVVIGILIALQVNNWNENRKILKQEKATIANLKFEFEKNLADLEGHIKIIQSIISAGNTLLEHTGPNYENGTLKNVDSLISLTQRMSIWDPSLYTLSDIKNSGKLSNLSNEELKVYLIEWESFYSNLLDWGDFYTQRGTTYFEYLVENANYRNLNSNRSAQLRSSKFEGSNQKLLRMVSFENSLTDCVFRNNFILGFYKEAKVKLTTIIDLCETYEE
ncbi:DUF6090 family protein [Aegicerativicinus sediminis]|uniref:DUF6090 family protein n=1 Tax=Aegicerativicinus sediminis TaxID=2893202 RepID=UPI00293B88B1|nr:DUF6090 family protein [Aegicerativicinus sediminis]